LIEAEAGAADNEEEEAEEAEGDMKTEGNAADWALDDDETLLENEEEKDEVAGGQIREVCARSVDTLASMRGLAVGLLIICAFVCMSLNKQKQGHSIDQRWLAIASKPQS
jgi:hypothetical protein